MGSLARSLMLVLGLLLPAVATAGGAQNQLTTGLALTWTAKEGVGLGLELAFRGAWRDDLTPLAGAGARLRWLGARRSQATLALIGGVGGVEMADSRYFPWWYGEVWAGGTWTRQAVGPSISVVAAKNLRRYFTSPQSYRTGGEFFHVQLSGSVTWDPASREWIDPTGALGLGMALLPMYYLF